MGKTGNKNDQYNNNGTRPKSRKGRPNRVLSTPSPSFSRTSKKNDANDDYSWRVQSDENYSSKVEGGVLGSIPNGLSKELESIKTRNIQSNVNTFKNDNKKRQPKRRTKKSPLNQARDKQKLTSKIKNFSSPAQPCRVKSMVASDTNGTTKKISHHSRNEQGGHFDLCGDLSPEEEYDFHKPMHVENNIVEKEISEKMTLKKRNRNSKSEHSSTVEENKKEYLNQSFNHKEPNNMKSQESRNVRSRHYKSPASIGCETDDDNHDQHQSRCPKNRMINLENDDVGNCKHLRNTHIGNNDNDDDGDSSIEETTYISSGLSEILDHAQTKRGPKTHFSNKSSYSKRSRSCSIDDKSRRLRYGRRSNDKSPQSLKQKESVSRGTAFIKDSDKSRQKVDSNYKIEETLALIQNDVNPVYFLNNTGCLPAGELLMVKKSKEKEIDLTLQHDGTNQTISNRLKKGFGFSKRNNKPPSKQRRRSATRITPGISLKNRNVDGKLVFDDDELHDKEFRNSGLHKTQLNISITKNIRTRKYSTEPRKTYQRETKNKTCAEVIELHDDSDDEDDEHSKENNGFQKYDLARFASGNKVFDSGCRTTLNIFNGDLKLLYIANVRCNPERSSKKSSVLYRQRSDENLKTISINLKNQVVGAKSFNNDDGTSENAPMGNNKTRPSHVVELEYDDENELPIYFIVLNVKLKSEKKSLQEFDSSCQEEKKTNNIILEFRSDKEFFNFRSDIKKFIPCECNKLVLINDPKVYAKPLIDHSKAEKKKRLRYNRKRSKEAFLDNLSDDDVLLVYPFDGNATEIEKSSEGLFEASSPNDNSNNTQEENSEKRMTKSGKASLAGGGDSSKMRSEEKNSESNTAKQKQQQLQNSRRHFVTIHVRDYQRLNHGEFLNDTFIDFWMQWITRSDHNRLTSNVHFFSSHFFTTLSGDGIKGVTNWTAKKGINVFEKTMVFIPVNQSFHWSLCVVVNPGEVLNESSETDQDKKNDSPLSCILFLDSLKAHKKNKVAKKVRAWLNSEWNRINSPPTDEESPFSIPSMRVYDPIIPYQDNGWDCGVFVCKYAHALYMLRNENYFRKDVAFVEDIESCREFDFGMNDIERLRDNMKTLTERLSKVYMPWKKEQDRNKTKEKREMKKKNDDSCSNEVGNACSNEVGNAVTSDAKIDPCRKIKEPNITPPQLRDSMQNLEKGNKNPVQNSSSLVIVEEEYSAYTLEKVEKLKDTSKKKNIQQIRLLSSSLVIDEEYNEYQGNEKISLIQNMQVQEGKKVEKLNNTKKEENIQQNRLLSSSLVIDEKYHKDQGNEKISLVQNMQVQERKNISNFHPGKFLVEKENFDENASV